MAVYRAVLWLLVAVLAGTLSWTAFSWYNGTAGREAPFGVPFSLVDQNGNTITQAAFRGRPTALFFGYTHCPDVCPTTLFELNGWLHKADPTGTKIGAYFVTVDPERDTPALLKQYISNVSDRIVGISGPPEAVHAMVKGFHIYSRKVPLHDGTPGDYSMDHTASVFLLDAKGRFRSTIAFGENAETAVKKLQNIIN
ncbi:MAG TPA: SCO family protein [Pararhizobium sp.]|nr:SCO family protein [Pararhizobium sp.]